MDYWQLAASLAAVMFNLSYVAQVRATFRSKTAVGISITQWIGFTAGSVIFIGFYINLQQWLMVVISLFGLACCLLIVGLLFFYHMKEKKNFLQAVN